MHKVAYHPQCKGYISDYPPWFNKKEFHTLPEIITAFLEMELNLKYLSLKFEKNKPSNTLTLVNQRKMEFFNKQKNVKSYLKSLPNNEKLSEKINLRKIIKEAVKKEEEIREREKNKTKKKYYIDSLTYTNDYLLFEPCKTVDIDTLYDNYCQRLDKERNAKLSYEFSFNSLEKENKDPIYKLLELMIFDELYQCFCDKECDDLINDFQEEIKKKKNLNTPPGKNKKKKKKRKKVKNEIVSSNQENLKKTKQEHITGVDKEKIPKMDDCHGENYEEEVKKNENDTVQNEKKKDVSKNNSSEKNSVIIDNSVTNYTTNYNIVIKDVPKEKISIIPGEKAELIVKLDDKKTVNRGEVQKIVKKMKNLDIKEKINKETKTLENNTRIDDKKEEKAKPKKIIIIKKKDNLKNIITSNTINQKTNNSITVETKLLETNSSSLEILSDTQISLKEPNNISSLTNTPDFKYNQYYNYNSIYKVPKIVDYENFAYNTNSNIPELILSQKEIKIIYENYYNPFNFKECTFPLIDFPKNYGEKIHNLIIESSTKAVNFIKRRKHLKYYNVLYLCGQIKKCFNSDVSVSIYGSYSTGTEIESSDIDISITLLSEIQKKKSIEMLIMELYNYLFSIAGFENLCAITTASVPILKMIINSEKLNPNNIPSNLEKTKIDLTFDLPDPKPIIEYTNAVLLSNPEIKPIFIMFKRLIKSNNLNSVFDGGLSSHSLFLMISSYFLYKNHVSRYNFGEIFIDLLHFYGNFFKYSNTIIDITQKK